MKFIMYWFSFWSTMFDDGVALPTLDRAKCLVATILHIANRPSIYNHPLVMKYITGKFNCRPP